MTESDQDFLLEEIKKFENHFIPLRFEHLTVFSSVLRAWPEQYRQRIIALLVANGKITIKNDYLWRVVL